MMVSMEKFAILAIVVAGVVVTTNGSAIRLDDSDSIKLSSDKDEFEAFYKQFMEYFRPPTVLQFATHNLCKNMRDQFVLAMSKKLWNMHDGFVRRFVHKLCDKKPHTMLKLWVAELFDSDGNGYIDDFEKNAILHMNNVE